VFHELPSRDREDGRASPPSRACSLRRGGRATWQPQGVGSEAYLNGTSQGPTPEDARKEGHIIRARCAPLSPASGFPVSRSQQVIHEIFGLRERFLRCNFFRPLNCQACKERSVLRCQIMSSRQAGQKKENLRSAHSKPTEYCMTQSGSAQCFSPNVWPNS